ncbi:MAG TPA: CHAT domain-containing protein [Candidatus Angelobacter sp.]|nr:CHAT domain-containing protein [Candidatus Angelobacter sp.]
MPKLYDDALQKMHQGYYDAAISQAGDGDTLANKREDAVWSWRFRLLEAEALMRNGMGQQSVALLAQDPPANSSEEITTGRWIVTGEALCRINQFTKGEASLAKADHLITSSQSALQAQLAFAHGSCSLVPATARLAFGKAAEQAHGVDLYIEASAIGNLGTLALGEEHYDEAIDRFREVVLLAQAIHSRVLEEKALGSLGFSYFQLGDFKGAINYSKRAAGIASELGRTDDQAKWLLDLGRAYASLPVEYPGEGEKNYLGALALTSKSQDTAGRCLHNLTQLAIENHDLSKAESYWKQELARHDNANDPDSSLDEAEIALTRKDFLHAAELFPAILLDPKIAVTRRALVQEHMGEAYWGQKKTGQAEQMFRESIRTVEKALTGIRPEYRVSLLDKDQFFEGYIRFLVAQAKTAKALQIAEHARALAQVANAEGETKVRFDIASIQSQLKKSKQIILDYQLTNNESFLWVITSSRFRVFTLPAHRELYTQIAAYNREIQDRNTENSAAGKRLYATLIQPAEKLIPKGSRVTIIPSKILYGINFETLLVPGAVPHYWIEDVEVQVANSIARVESSGSGKPKPAKELLLIGAPVEVNKDFPVLRNAADEMRRLEKRFSGNGSKSISSQAATPSGYLSSRPEEYRFIHFVTHGTASETVPMESAIILSSDTGGYKLYARDIVKVPLHADLVTISACYGAGTRWYQSEGIVGLSWAFLRAGAHQVVAGLWEVDDATTPELMDNFYAELQKGKTAAEALRLAKLKMVKSKSLYANPYYWASLQLYTGS